MITSVLQAFWPGQIRDKPLAVVLGGQREVHLGDVADVGRVAGAGRPERPDERILHAENGVAVEVGVFRVENVRGDGPVAGCGDYGVDWCGPPVMTARPAAQVA